jgi:hypothetical protein
MSVRDYVSISVFHRRGNGQRTRFRFLLLGVLQLVLLLSKLLFPPPSLSVHLKGEVELTAIEHATPTSLYMVSLDSLLRNRGMQEAYHAPSLGGADGRAPLEKHSDCFSSA